MKSLQQRKLKNAITPLTFLEIKGLKRIEETLPLRRDDSE
jgi:hypothetical protein